MRGRLKINTNIKRFFDHYYRGLTSDLYSYFTTLNPQVPNYFSITKTYSINFNNNTIQGRDLPSGVPVGYYNLGYSIIQQGTVGSNPIAGITNIDYHGVPGITRDARHCSALLLHASHLKISRNFRSQPRAHDSL